MELPLKVLDEIDAHKKRQDGVGTNARQIIRQLILMTGAMVIQTQRLPVITVMGLLQEELLLLLVIIQFMCQALLMTRH